METILWRSFSQKLAIVVHSGHLLVNALLSNPLPEIIFSPLAESALAYWCENQHWELDVQKTKLQSNL